MVSAVGVVNPQTSIGDSEILRSVLYREDHSPIDERVRDVRVSLNPGVHLIPQFLKEAVAYGVCRKEPDGSVTRLGPEASLLDLLAEDKSHGVYTVHTLRGPSFYADLDSQGKRWSEIAMSLSPDFASFTKRHPGILNSMSSLYSIKPCGTVTIFSLLDETLAQLAFEGDQVQFENTFYEETTNDRLVIPGLPLEAYREILAPKLLRVNSINYNFGVTFYTRDKTEYGNTSVSIHTSPKNAPKE